MRKILKIISLLEKEYETRKFTSFDDPLDELIVTILSQNTTWQNCKRAFDNLKKKFNDWGKVMKAGKKEIESAIKCGGLGNIKAQRIKNVLNEIYIRKKTLDLRFLAKMKTDAALNFLTSLNGVGPKTASCLLLFYFKKPVLPVDTHILRVSKRLDLIGEDTNLAKAHKLLLRIVPTNKLLPFHIKMIEHGRNICRARSPKCTECIFTSYCHFIHSVHC